MLGSELYHLQQHICGPNKQDRSISSQDYVLKMEKEATTSITLKKARTLDGQTSVIITSGS